jgi:hypothetical protein
VQHEQLEHLAPQLLIAPARRGEECGALGKRHVERLHEQSLHALVVRLGRLAFGFHLQ